MCRHSRGAQRRALSTIATAAVERLLDIERAGVEQVRVRAPASAARSRGERSRSSRRRMSARTSASSAGSPRAPQLDGRGGWARTSGVAVTKIFTSALGQITVPMSRPSSTAPGGCCGKAALEREQRRAHLGDRRHHRSRLADLVALQRRLVERAGSIASAAAIARAAIAGLMAGVEQRLRHRAIEQPGVEMAQPVMRGELLAERALAGRGRPVDGDDHERSAPRPRIRSAKAGKLVAMNAASSTCTGCSLRSPITSADIAMR